ncbi:MAG: hypothetical protein AB1529_02055 [Candidatus Micrarchaeota archaeon]
MDAEEAKLELCHGAHLIAPMDFIEPLPGNGRETMLSLIARCEELFGPEPLRGPLYLWLERLIGRKDFAFYGSAVSGLPFPSDIDILSFTSPAPHLHSGRPEFVHIHPMPMPCDSNDPPGLFLAGPLLFASAPDVSQVLRIRLERQAVERAPFFRGGIGELITHAAYKALECGEECDPDGESGFGRIAHLELSLRRHWLDMANMCTNTYNANQLNNQVRKQMREMNEEDARELVRAAMRRLRVKDVQRAGLEERFMTELKARKIFGSFG